MLLDANFCFISNMYVFCFYSNKNMSTIPKDLIETAASADVTTIDFSKNNISEIPNQ